MCPILTFPVSSNMSMNSKDASILIVHFSFHQASAFHFVPEGKFHLLTLYLFKIEFIVNTYLKVKGK